MNQNPQNPQEGQTQPAPGVAPVQMTPEQLQLLMQTVRPQAAPQQSAPPTQEQLDKMLNRFTYTPEIDAAIFNPATTPEQRMAAMNQILRGVILEAGTLSRMQSEHLANTMFEQLEEPLSYAAEYGQRQLFDQLYDGHPGLKALDPLVKQLVTSLSAAPDFPRAPGERPGWLRERIVTSFKGSMPTFDPKVAPGQPNQQQQQNQHQQQQPANQPASVFLPPNMQQQQAPVAPPAQTPPPSNTPASTGGGMGGGSGAAHTPSVTAPGTSADTKHLGATGFGW